MSRRVAVVVLICLTAACSGEEPPRGRQLSGGGPTNTVTGSSVTATSTTVAPAEIDLTLLEPGAPPLERIRLSPSVGSVQRVTLRIDSTQRIAVLNGWMDVPLPVFEIDLANTVTGTDGGRISVDQAPFGFRIVDQRGLLTDEVDELTALLDRLVELSRTTIVIDDRGAVVDQTHVGEGALYDLPTFEGLVTTTSDASIPLPSEPIGVGGRWQVRSDSVVSGMRMLTTTDVELIEIHEDRVVARIDQAVTMPRDYIQGSRQRDEVIRGDITTTGTVTWHLTDPLPLVDLDGTGTIETRYLRGRTTLRSLVEQHLRTTTILRTDEPR